MESSRSLSGVQKAAVLCIYIGAERAAKMLKFLQDDEIEEITVEVARMNRISVDDRDTTLVEFAQLGTAQKHIRSGSVEYAWDVLERALGAKRASEIFQRLTSSLQKRPFDFVQRTDPTQLANFLQNEHPQTIAVIMAHLPPEQAAVVLMGLPPERQADVFKRVSTIQRTAPEMLREAERVLERKISALAAQEGSAAGGIPWAVEVLNRVDRSAERKIMEVLSADDPELAAEIAQRMFLFDDIVVLDDRSVQRVLREIDMNKDLPLALKAAKDEVWRKILVNISTRAGEVLKEAVEYLGPVRIRDVEEAQGRIVASIRKLEDAGEIQISRGGSGDEFI